MISQEIRKLAPEQDPLRMGMGWTAQDLEKPQVLIESTYGQSHPGSAHLLQFAHEEWIDQQLESGKTVWFIGSGLARDGILKEWQKRGIKSVETADSCLLERYWFNIYRLGRQP